MFNRRNKWFQLSQRQRMSPFPNYLSMESICREMREVVGNAYREVILIMQHNVMHVFMDQDDHERVGHRIMGQVLQRPDFFVRLAKRQRAFAKSFYAFLKKSNTPRALAGSSNVKLATLHREYARRYKQVYSHYFPVLAIELYFFDYLRKYITSREPDTRRAAKYVDTLITERAAMVNRQEKIAALRLAARIQKYPTWKGIFRNKDPHHVISEVRAHPALLRMFRAHERQWFWITRDYDDPVLTLENFITRIAPHVTGEPERRLERLRREDERLRADIATICRKLRIDLRHQRLFQTMREGIYFKELRKAIVSQTLYYYDPILAEIARRGFITIRQARHLKTDEVQPLLNGRDMTHELNERIRQSAWHVRNGKAKVYIGNVAQRYVDFFIKVNPAARELRGMPVSPGQAKGPAKIVINPDSFKKVKRGDVIVTIQATPVFSPILSIASALICDGGPGITSHPATLAREAGIPGIIALRMATKILKDGQVVAVDGDQGVVTIKK